MGRREGLGREWKSYVRRVRDLWGLCRSWSWWKPGGSGRVRGGWNASEECCEGHDYENYSSVPNRTVYLDSKGITLDVGFRKFGCIYYYYHHLALLTAFRILLLSVIPSFINSINKNSRVVSIPAKNICQKGEEVSSELNVDHFDFSGLT